MSDPNDSGSRPDLAEGWERSTLGEMGRYLNGRGFTKKEWRQAGRPIIRIQNLTDPSKPFNYFDGEADERHTARSGDLLVSWAATLDVFRWEGPEAVVNQHIFKVESFVDVDLHYWALRASLDALRAQTHGTAMVHITRDRFLGTPVCIPPEAEQQSVVAEIDSRFAALDEADQSLDDAASKLSLLRRSVLDLAAKSGDEQCVGDLLDGIEAGKSFQCHGRRAINGEWGVIKVSAMTYGAFREEENKAVIDENRVDPRWEIRSGDLLVSRANTSQYVGAAVLVEDTRPRLLLSDKSLRLTVGDEVDPAWLQLALSAPSTRKQMSLAATGTSDSMRNLSQDRIRAIRVRVPTRAKQERLVQDAARRLDGIERMRQGLDSQLELSQVLRRAVLSRTFSREVGLGPPVEDSDPLEGTG